MGSGWGWCRVGSLWGRLLGLLSDLWLHLGFQLPVGLATLPLRRLELLFLRLGMGPRGLRRMVSGDCCARSSSGMDDANPANTASGRYTPDRGCPAGGCQSWSGGHWTMGPQQWVQANGGSSAGFEFPRAAGGASGEDRGSSGICCGQGHGSGISRSFGAFGASSAAKSCQLVRVGRQSSACGGKPEWPSGSRAGGAPQYGLCSATGAPITTGAGLQPAATLDVCGAAHAYDPLFGSATASLLGSSPCAARTVFRASPLRPRSS
jgi:hypothetical protein